jgi:CDP-diacylglycerol---glycerol-3-phosphate 3-phosphatidyltransferase
MHPAAPSQPADPLRSGGLAPVAVGWRRWLPNAITLSRLVLAAVFFAQLALWSAPASWSGGAGSGVETWRLWLAAACFGVAAGTDALDGYLARRWGAITRFGRIMDPFADKILIVGAFVMLAGPRFTAASATGPFQITGIESWMVVVVLGRELLVTSIRAVLEAEGKDFSASFTGKLKMILQSIVVPLVLIVPAMTDVSGGWGSAVVIGAAWATVLVTVLSGVPYVLRGMAAFAETDRR